MILFAHCRYKALPRLFKEPKDPYYKEWIHWRVITLKSIIRSLISSFEEPPLGLWRSITKVSLDQTFCAGENSKRNKILHRRQCPPQSRLYKHQLIRLIKICWRRHLSCKVASENLKINSTLKKSKHYSRRLDCFVVKFFQDCLKNNTRSC